LRRPIRGTDPERVEPVALKGHRRLSFRLRVDTAKVTAGAVISGSHGLRIAMLASSVLLASNLAAAASPGVEPPAGPAEASVRVWYRSSDQCPDGDAFIGLLSRLGRAAVLAGVGDRVDFVVTVARDTPHSTGRLERQSRERTVAVREVSAASCAEVAEMLALSLYLAVQSGAEPGPAAIPGSGAGDGWQQRIGGQGTLETGLARLLLAGGALFVAVRPPERAWSARLSLRGAYAQTEALLPLQVAMLAARLEACWTWGVSNLELSPCLGWDVGLVLAESPGDTGRSDVGAWNAALAHGRGAWPLGPNLSLEAQVGLLVPLVRYRFRARTGEEVTDSAALGLQAALGLSFRL
jgi:hypothetical protein